RSAVCLSERNARVCKPQRMAVRRNGKSGFVEANVGLVPVGIVKGMRHLLDALASQHKSRQAITGI
ncbi:MAG: hypothetical protein OIF57_08785, partial [Marinobacterium sp.]|nr:hypothetical protein [Marinobacterium sp.]